MLDDWEGDDEDEAWYPCPPEGWHANPLQVDTCLFPGKCLMTGDHSPTECYTAEFAQEYYEHMERENPL
jgi:hypothetical protein